jgi:protein SCO1/2
LEGNPRDLYEFADGMAPTLLVLGTARCNAPCQDVLPAVAAAIPRLGLEPGRDFRLLTVSLDPKEPIEASAARQATLLTRIGYSRQRWRWHYLHASREALTRLTGALGLRFAWDARGQQYIYPNVAFVLTPKGRLARCLNNSELEPRTMADALAAAYRADRPQQAESYGRTLPSSEGNDLPFAVGLALIPGVLFAMSRRRRRAAEATGEH